MSTAVAPYHPTELDASRFWNKQHSRDVHDVQLPLGYPSYLRSPLAWTRAEVEKRSAEWVLELHADEIEAINVAVRIYVEKQGALSDISQETFKLPDALALRLRGVSDQCYKNMGFQIVRGLDPSSYTAEQNAIIFAGIAAHVAPIRGFLDYDHEVVMNHVVNVLGDDSEKKPAPAFSNGPVSFHTDNCELMSLYCLSQASTGGRTLLSSSWQVYNELVANCPQILDTLTEPWVLDTFKDYNKAPPTTMRFLDHVNSEKILMRFSRYPITGWLNKRNPDLPAPTPAQLEALDAVQFTAASNCIALPMNKGDMVFLNDMTLMHAREPFEEAGSAKRHLLKMYLHDPKQNWEVAPSAVAQWNKMYGSNRPDGGREEIFWTMHTGGDEGKSTTNG